MKVLIISHNPISTFNNMGKTIGSLFSNFSRGELCQLYVHPSVPDLNVCNSYYRITDRDILMSFIKCSVHGEVVRPNLEQHKSSDDSKSGKLYRKIKPHGAMSRLIRDALWKFAHWNNRYLKEWIEHEQPSCIFVAPGAQKFLYDIAFVISKQKGIPIVSYICDDYYFLQRRSNLIVNYANFCIRRKIKKMMNISKHVVFICDPMKRKYQSHFNIVSATTIMTGTVNAGLDTVQTRENVKSFVYMGNLYYGREKSLAQIGRVLDEINLENNMACSLDVYSGDITDAIKKEFENIVSVRFCGFVSGEEYSRIKSEADVFIHVEGFDLNNFDMVKYSVSTKIAETLASGKVLLAYGPAEVASMQHLTDNDYIFAVSDRERLKDAICVLVNDMQVRTNAINQALLIFSKYHLQDKNSEKLREVLLNSCN